VESYRSARAFNDAQPSEAKRLRRKNKGGFSAVEPQPERPLTGLQQDAGVNVNRLLAMSAPKP
jgi:hypothetical protein